MIIFKLFFIIFILTIFYFYLKDDFKINENFENKTHNNTDHYDKQYIKFYNYINDLKKEHKEDLEILFKKNIFNHSDKNATKILDAGCGSGIISDYLQKKGYDLTCVDKSESFLKHAELNNIFNRYILGNLENTQLFDNNEFNIIISDYDSFYLNNYASMINILKNYYLWLKNDGFIIFYLFNNKFLDPSPRNYSQYYFDNKGNKHSLTYFEGFSHNAWFIKDKFIKNKFLFYEKILIEKTLKSRIKITNYFIPDKNDLLKMIENNGFKVSDIISFNDQNEYEIIILNKK
jgi:SAM-dependent methyltransferase